MQARDDAIHFQLRNWAAHINSEWDAGPREYPQGSSWHSQIINRQDANFPEGKIYIDEDNAERVQAALVRMMINDMRTAQVLILHYRDDFKMIGLKKARHAFWRWL